MKVDGHVNQGSSNRFPGFHKQLKRYLKHLDLKVSLGFFLVLLLKDLKLATKRKHQTVLSER